MQFLAGLQIEPIDHADDGLWRLRTQRFHQCPQNVGTMRRLHQDCAARIEAETIEAMSRQSSALPRFVARHHEDDFFAARRFWEQAAGQHRDNETERDRERSLRCRDNLMQRAGKPTIRQAAIKCGKAETERGLLQALGPARLSRQQKAQFGQSGSAALCRG